MKYSFIILFTITSLVTFGQNNYQKQWAEVDSLSEIGQPKSALELVSKIYLSAKEQKDAPQFVKASLYRIKLQSDFEEDYMETAISSLETEVITTPSPLSQVIHSMLAELYWGYYENHRYLFLDRAETVGYESSDIKTWSLKKILQVTMQHYSKSLEYPADLKSTSLKMYDAILLVQKGSGKFRPTLYDFLAHRVVDFYMNSESGLTQPAYVFTVNNPLYLAPAQIFSGLSITTKDSLSFEYNALQIMQDLITFHFADKDPLALIDVDLERLKFVYQNIVIPAKDSIYLSTLRSLENKFSDHPGSTEVSYEIANVLYTSSQLYQPLVSDGHKWDIKEALSTCNNAIKRFPDSDGAANCKYLREMLNQQSLNLTIGYANVPDKPFTALLAYRNITKVFFRLVKSTPDQDRDWRDNNVSENLYKTYLTLPVEKSWSVDLPGDGDFQSHKAEVRIPDLANGYYILLSSPDPDFSPDSKILAANNFWVTSISYVSRQSDEGAYSIYLADRQEGTPLGDVKAHTYFREYDYTSRKYENNPGPDFTSDKDGFIVIPYSDKKQRNNSFYIDFQKGNDRFATENYFYQYSYSPVEPRAITTTYFYTDRAIYRPGQTIYFKGIVLEKQGDDTQIKSKFKTTVTFYDANGQKVSTLDLVTNDYGSVTGSFTAPTGVLTGQLYLGNETGNVYFRVEEYKRPKFEVTFKPVEGSYKLNQTVIVTGKASAYAGNSISDAQVKYRVVRQARFPFMCWGWRDIRPSSPDMEISNGITTTNIDGGFSISFTAIPDETVNHTMEPVFNYVISAEVSDINGETHSADVSVAVGTKALLINTDLPEMGNRDSVLSFTLKTSNLNGTKEPAKGDIVIWKLRVPERLMRDRQWDRPDIFLMSREEFYKNFPFDVYDNENDFSNWEKQDKIYSYAFDTRTDSLVTPAGAGKWPVGRYVMEITTKDSYGETVETKTFFTVFSANEKEIPDNSIAWFTMLNGKAEPGKKASFLFGSNARKVHAIYEIENKGKIISRQLVDLSQGQKAFEIPVTEDFRGNFSVNIIFVKYDRSFQYSKIIEVPFTNKKLDVKFAVFRDKLSPGQSEEWRIDLENYEGEEISAEMLATMYDASLDAFAPLNWSLDIFNSTSVMRAWENNAAFGKKDSHLFKYPVISLSPKFREYDQLNWFGYNFSRNNRLMRGVKMSSSAMSMDGAIGGEQMDLAQPEANEKTLQLYSIAGEKGERPASSNNTPSTQQDGVKIRSNFNETAFFFPQLSTNEEGEVFIKFTVPESLTRWKMMGLAYTQDLEIGQIEKTVVTQKELMVVPNPPRFFREGDHMDFQVKVSNIAGKDLEVGTEIQFFDALTMKPLRNILKVPQQINVSISKGQSKVVSWEIDVPEGLQAITYRVTAQSGIFSDGEEMAIPVLTNRMLVTESLPLPVNGKQTKTFKFDKLLNSGLAGSTLRNHKLTLEFTSNPAWYAVQALPYIMEYPYQCAEQVFSRYYANSIATHIANSNPKIKRVFDRWKNLSPDALRSNLEKNQELKSVILEETPWVLQSNNESERKQHIALLFDLNRMSNELSVALKQLRDMQSSNGGWPWFAGMPESRYITQHIVTGLGHLSHLGITNIRDNANAWEMMRKAVLYLDDRMNDDYEEILKYDKEPLKTNHLGCDNIQYLYARSYFLTDIPVATKNTKAFDYFREQAVKFWPKQNNYMKGMLALALNRMGVKTAPSLIMRSLSETALHNEELGMYWRNSERGFYWYQSPVETQALLIEAFDEVANDTKAVEELKIWLLKQKQTQDWKTTKATTEAIYALLLRGSDLLASDNQVAVTVGNTLIDPNKSEGDKPEAGTGYFKTSWDAGEIKPEMGKITIVKSDEGIAWGAMYWQYFEQLDKITPSQTPLKLEKKLFAERNSPTGPVIEPVTESTPLKIGDKVNVRIELRVDRDMEYIHLKDMRASAFEPVNVLSEYKYQGGLGYYEATKDASTNFFISYLPKGTYVFSYSLVASQTGDFSNGITSIQCMYAPEFSAHSEGIRITVK
ncbi:MAG: alpha-2-macroglobulin family protein [Bacteroidales bacterium]